MAHERTRRSSRRTWRLDVLVNDIFGGDRYTEWDKPVWGARLGRRRAHAVDGPAYAPDHLSCRHPAHVAHRRNPRHVRPDPGRYARPRTRHESPASPGRESAPMLGFQP